MFLLPTLLATRHVSQSSTFPSLPLLARIMAAVDLKLRISLADYDAHDDVLDAEDARLTPFAGRRAA